MGQKLDLDYFKSSLIELQSLSQLTQKVFGPVLHLIRYRESTNTAAVGGNAGLLAQDLR
jgi:delta 1-pyrroline-5-carboxylate dehydrogenase